MKTPTKNINIPVLVQLDQHQYQFIEFYKRKSEIFYFLFYLTTNIYCDKLVER